MAEQQAEANNLIHLGAGVGSKVENIKQNSTYLRGKIAEELQQDTSRFSEDQIQLLKFHGTYQQEDRDQRQARKAAGAEKAYQFMVRSRIPGGVLTAEQYLAEDEIAGRYGNGSIRFTTRQGIQLHGVLKGNLHATIKAINDALLSTLAACGDVNRNTMGCPAPTASRAHARVHEIARTLALHFAPRSRAYHEIWLDGEQIATVEHPEDKVVEPIYGSSYLPRKFKIGVAFPGDNCIDVYTQDIGLVAYMENQPGTEEEQLAGFTVLVGGGMGATHGKAETYPYLAQPLCYITADEVIEVAQTIMSIQRDYGDRQNRKHARMKYVVAERGTAWFRAELERRLGRSVQDPHPLAWRDVEDHLGWHDQGDGKWFLGLLIDNGRVKDTGDVRVRSGLRAVVSEFRPGVHITPHQNVLLTDIPGEQREQVTAHLAEYGIETDPDKLGLRRFAMACPALPTCGLAVAESERVAPALVSAFEDELRALGLENERVTIRISGCPNGCSRPYLGDIGIIGRSKGIYNIQLGGDQAGTHMNMLYAELVRQENLAATMRPLFKLWRDERQAGEAFGDFCYRVGFAYLREQTAPENGEVVRARAS